MAQPEPSPPRRCWFQFSLKSLLGLFAIAFLIQIPNLAIGAESPKESLRERVTKVSPEDTVTISVDDSQVSVETPVIVAMIGDSTISIEDILNVMSEKDTTFDAFVRFCSVVEGKLKRRGDKFEIPWYGGVKDERDEKGVVRFQPGGQMDVARFREDIILAIRRHERQIPK